MPIDRLITVILVTAGCAAAEPGDATQDDRVSVEIGHCPDPSTDCTQSNGTGVYFEEDGDAGIDAPRFMITHFINQGTSVGIQGRYYDPVTQRWLTLAQPGVISSADFRDATQLRVLRIVEGDTLPTWTLADAGGTTTAVTGARLVDLKLHVTIAVDASRARRYVLEFDHASTASGKHPVRAYNMRWRSAADQLSPPVQYCTTASGSADPVVFQQGMDVDPVTGRVTRSPLTRGFVTLSCLRGALAIAYQWGYRYREPANTYYFDAAIHMKRASYCADAKYYTVAGTAIQISDNDGVHHDPIAHLEAWWTPDGASCVDMAHLRHPELGFTGACNSAPRPPCPIAMPQFLLADGSEPN